MITKTSAYQIQTHHTKKQKKSTSARTPKTIIMQLGLQTQSRGPIQEHFFSLKTNDSTPPGVQGLRLRFFHFGRASPKLHSTSPPRLKEMSNEESPEFTKESLSLSRVLEDDHARAALEQFARSMHAAENVQAIIAIDMFERKHSRHRLVSCVGWYWNPCQPEATMK